MLKGIDSDAEEVLQHSYANSWAFVMAQNGQFGY
jgi:hypothetical protein